MTHELIQKLYGIKDDGYHDLYDKIVTDWLKEKAEKLYKHEDNELTMQQLEWILGLSDKRFLEENK